MGAGDKNLKVAVIGLWHLGCVTAACLAQGEHHVIAYDSNQDVIQKLQQGTAPIFEPGLDELLIQSKAAGMLNFSSDPRDLTQADIIWVTYDTPVDNNDVADVAFVTNEVEKLFSYLQKNALIIISSQIPVGTTRKLLDHYTKEYPAKNITFACRPRFMVLLN